MNETAEMRQEVKTLKAQVGTMEKVIGYILKDLNIHFDEEGGTIPALMDRVYEAEVTVEALVSIVKDAAETLQGDLIERRAMK